MYVSDKRELLVRNSQLIQELSAECGPRERRGENVSALRSRIDELAARQEILGDELFGVRTIRYRTLHHCTFSNEVTP